MFQESLSNINYDAQCFRKVCKNCGCPRGSHKIQKFIEEKKEVPRPILIQTADEDEEDYKELEVGGVRIVSG